MFVGRLVSNIDVKLYVFSLYPYFYSIQKEKILYFVQFDTMKRWISFSHRKIFVKRVHQKTPKDFLGVFHRTRTEIIFQPLSPPFIHFLLLPPVAPTKGLPPSGKPARTDGSRHSASDRDRGAVSRSNGWPDARRRRRNSRNARSLLRLPDGISDKPPCPVPARPSSRPTRPKPRRQSS